MSSSRTSSLLTYGGLVVSMLLWASSFVVLKLAFREFAPMFVIWGRMLVACAALVVMKPFIGRFNFKRADLKYLLLMALCEPCIYFILEAKAVQLTTASQAGMITALLPVLVAIVAHFSLGEKSEARTILGCGLAVGGAIWLSLLAKPEQGAPNPMLGNFLEFLAMVCATGYTVMAKRLSARYSPMSLTAFQCIVGAVFYLPLALIDGLPQSFSLQGLSCVLYLGLAISLGAYGLYNFGISRIPANQASIFVNLIPVFTVIMAAIVLGEKFTPLQYPASLMVLVGVFLSQNHPQARTRTPHRTRLYRDDRTRYQ